MQEDEKTKTFCGRDVRITKVVLVDANKIMVPVLNSIGKFSMGETDLFLHLRPADLENIQQVMCKYIFWKDTGKNLTLFDLSEGLSEFMLLVCNFLEFNFGFFSQARKISMILVENGQNSGQEETTKES